MPPRSSCVDFGLPPAVASQLWRGDALGHAASRTVSTGFAALDQQLPGAGWPVQCVTEVLSKQFGVAEWRLLLPALAPALSDAQPLIAIGCPHQPFVPGLAQAGVPSSRFIWVQPQTPAQGLWATEQAIQSGGPGAVMAWLPQARPEQIRRLQAHALQSQAPVFLMRPDTASRQASAAPLRVVLTLLAPTLLGVQILKRRGAQHEGVIPLRALASRLSQVLPSSSPATPATHTSTPGRAPHRPWGHATQAHDHHAVLAGPDPAAQRG